MSRRPALLGGVFCLLAASGCKSFEDDLREMCRIATTVDSDRTIARKDKFKTLVRRTRAECETRAFRRFLDRFLETPPDMRHELARREARSRGMARWACPALERTGQPELVVKQAVAISRSAILVRGEPVVELEGGFVPERFKPRGAGDFFVEPLHRALQARIAALEREGDEKVVGNLRLAVHPETLHRVVAEVLHTAEKSGFLSFDLSLEPGGGEPARALVRRPSGRPSKLDFTVGILYSAFVFTGKGLHEPPVRCKARLAHGICPRYDHAAVAAVVRKTKKRHPDERLAFLVAYRTVPYREVHRVLRSIRGTPTPACTGDDGCFFDRVVLRAGAR